MSRCTAEIIKHCTTGDIKVHSYECEVLECVNLLERRTRLFASYIFDDLESADLPGRILEYMNDSLSEIFTCKIQDLWRTDIAVVAVHAFYCTSELEDYREQCSKGVHFFGDLLTCYILRYMRREFTSRNEPEFVEDYKQKHKMAEMSIIKLLRCLDQKDHQSFIDYLETDYRGSHIRKHSGEPACSIQYALDLAMLAKCEKVLNHSSARKSTNERWMPQINTHISRYRFIFAFFTIVPIFFISFYKKDNLIKNGDAEVSDLHKIELPKKKRNLSPWKKIKTFYSSPCSNFCVHTTFYFFYIFLYAAVLLHKPPRMDAGLRDFHLETVLYLWQIAFIAEMVHFWVRQGFTKFFARNPSEAAHNILNTSWILSWIFASVLHDFKSLSLLWGALVVLSKVFFLISFIFSSVRVIRVFSADSFFGAIVVMVRKMVFTLGSLFIVILIFWCTYAIAMVSMIDNAPATHDMAWSIFTNGAFEIFGEVRDNMRNGEVEDCPAKFDSSNINDFTIDCLFRSWTIPILLFTYVLVSSVLLVNLVTSFLSNTFEQVKDSSMITYRYKHYQRLYEYERKCRIPAPLSIVYYIALLFVELIQISGNVVSRLCNREGEDMTKSSEAEIVELVQRRRRDTGINIEKSPDNALKSAHELELLKSEKYKSKLPACVIRPLTSCEEKRNLNLFVIPLYCRFKKRNKKGRAVMAFVKVKPTGNATDS